MDLPFETSDTRSNREASTLPAEPRYRRFLIVEWCHEPRVYHRQLEPAPAKPAHRESALCLSCWGAPAAESQTKISG